MNFHNIPGHYHHHYKNDLFNIAEPKPEVRVQVKSCKSSKYLIPNSPNWERQKLGFGLRLSIKSKEYIPGSDTVSSSSISYHLPDIIVSGSLTINSESNPLSIISKDSDSLAINFV